MGVDSMFRMIVPLRCVTELGLGMELLCLKFKKFAPYKICH